MPFDGHALKLILVVSQVDGAADIEPFQAMRFGGSSVEVCGVRAQMQA